ncbi:sugar kinase [Sedimentitalea sp. JM2-8]|uniref:Sugar kinase n=1 Tax=Sedimentitalea xiamensis TaxID=3050037 RepID=A0ABT7FHW5_9RHOB|nr:sugar kinase [Sedimentitalea xiamensis]MDK3074706.1 sugar kinase [Sedimentitalea xiamensis]
MTSILGIGECMIELSPAEGSLLRQGFAGDVFNTLWYAKATGGPDAEVAFFTAVGDDPISDRMLAFAATAGIRCDSVPRIPGRRPGLYVIHLTGAERTFSYWRDTSAARLMMRHANRLWPQVADADFVYFSGITLAILSHEDCELFLGNLRARMKPGARVAFDPNLRPHLWDDADRMRRVISRAAGLSDIVLPSFDDECRNFGDAAPEDTARRYGALGADQVVVKNGPLPTLLLNKGGMQDFPVPPVEGVVDTTAAGDSFNGAYLSALGRGAAVAQAIAVAQACSAQVVYRKGALVPFSDLRI